jgi:DNA-binding PadR family transcriptional regulator
MLTKKIKYISCLVAIVLFVAVAFAFNIFPNKESVASAVSIDQQTSSQTPDSVTAASKIEYIKTNQSDGYIEYWRDTVNLKDRVDTYDTKGALVSSYIITDKGSRVIHRFLQNGEPVNETWVLPSKIAEENQKIMKISLLEKAKNDLKNTEWQTKGTENLSNGKEANVYTANENGEIQKVYTDPNTGYPIKKQIFKEENGNLQLIDEKTLEYKLVDNTTSIFEPNATLQEIKAPVVDNNVGKG